MSDVALLLDKAKNTLKASIRAGQQGVQVAARNETRRSLKRANGLRRGRAWSVTVREAHKSLRDRTLLQRWSECRSSNSA